jgi:nucleotide-binding universal stress UspA family protein
MAIRFNTLLVPVDFSSNTTLAIAKALELIGDSTASIYLLHVHQIKRPGIISFLRHSITGYSRKEINERIKEAESRLLKIKEEIELSKSEIRVITSVVFSSTVEESIAQKATLVRPDLIIIGKRSHHHFIPLLNTVVPSRLAKTSGSAVLTAKPGSMHSEIRTVVIPLGKRFPGKKLEIVEALSQKLRLQVRLVTFSADENDPAFSRQTVINTFRLLKSNLSVPVGFEVLRGNNKANALLKYCNKIGADVLIVHPGSETRMSGWIRRHISDLLPADSRTQVLAVHPS